MSGQMLPRGVGGDRSIDLATVMFYNPHLRPGVPEEVSDELLDRWSVSWIGNLLGPVRARRKEPFPLRPRAGEAEGSGEAGMAGAPKDVLEAPDPITLGMMVIIAEYAYENSSPCGPVSSESVSPRRTWLACTTAC